MATTKFRTSAAAKTAPKASPAPVAPAPAVPAPPAQRRRAIFPASVGFGQTPLVAPAPAAPVAPPVPASLLIATLSERATRKRLSKAQTATLNMRKELWPEVVEDHLWLRASRVGFTTIPRTMPLFMELIADVSKRVTAGGKSVPAGKAYFVLWCRVFDEAVVKIEVEAAAATEAGYVGERNITTWREHLRVLQELGFIDVKPGMAGPYQFVLLLNPYHAVRKLRDKGWVQDMAWTALFQRAQEIGATDLTE